MPDALLLAPAFRLWGGAVTWIEVLAFVLSIWMVLCNLRVNVLAWPLAIVSSLLYAWLFRASGLYGEAALQFLFVVMAVWGWRQWLRGRRDGGSSGGWGGRPLVVHRLAPRARLAVAAATLAVWPLAGLLLDRATDSTVPYLDALPTAGSITATLLLGRKLVENWPAWVAVNAVSIVLFAVKGLWLTVLLYAVFVLLALAGWRAWARLAHG